MKKYPMHLIVAATPDGEIGYNNTIPWKLRGDLQRFKRITDKGIVILGRNTLQSLPNGLPGRSMIVVSKTLADPRGGIARKFRELDIIERVMAPHYVPTFMDAVLDASIWGNDESEVGDVRKVFVMGGARLYEEAIEMAVAGILDLTVHLTTVYKDPETPGYDTKIGNMELLDHFQVVGDPEEVYDELYETHDQLTGRVGPQHLDPGGWYWPDCPKPLLLSRTLSHTYTTLVRE